MSDGKDRPFFMMLLLLLPEVVAVVSVLGAIVVKKNKILWVIWSSLYK